MPLPARAGYYCRDRGDEVISTLCTLCVLPSAILAAQIVILRCGLWEYKEVMFATSKP